MSSATAQVSFAAELITMLVAASGLVLAARQSSMLERTRTSLGLLGVGFVVLGVGAFLHGSLILSAQPGTGLALSRLVAVAFMLAGSLRWQAGIRPRVCLLAGLGLVTAAALVEVAGASVVAGDILLAVGAATVGFPLVVTGRRSIATRVAVASAGTLLLVLVVVSVAMSDVISSSVTSQDLNRLALRGRSEGIDASAAANVAAKDARFVAGDLQGYFRSSNPNPLVALGTTQAGRDAPDQAAISVRLNQLSQLYPVDGFAYLLPGNALAASSGGLPAKAQSVTTVPGLQPSSCSGREAGRIVVRADAVWAVGTFPECGSDGSLLLGTVISVAPLDDAYLVQRRQADPNVSLALVGHGQVLASSGSQPSQDALRSLDAEADHSGVSNTTTVGGQFVSVQPIVSGVGTADSLSLVASSSTTTVVSATQNLFRTLFLIALGSTLAALVLAVVVGERITAGVRRLTDVAGRIQAGQASERVGSLGRDEVGVLAAAFDSMIDSVEDHAAALRTAADDETRLRNRLEAVVAGIGDSLVAIDVDGRVTEVNASAEELFGVRVAAVRGSPVHTVIVGQGEDGASLDDLLRCPPATGWESLATVKGAAGGDVHVAISAGPVRGPAGELIGAVVVLRDLRSEQELERMKTEFLSRVGHELRTPLTVIMGYVDILLRREVESARARDWHEEIFSGAKRLLRIVEMLEFFASSGAGHVRLRPEPLDVRSLVSGVATKWGDRLGDEHPVVRRVDPKTPPILADRRWLVLALDELIDNAAKFSPVGGRISITAGPGPVRNPSGDPPDGPLSGQGARRPMVEISVGDRGEGMTAEQEAMAFGEFVQADSSDTRRFGGLGLGLALVKRVVEGHGGTVSCRSAPGKGSTFIVRMPADARRTERDEQSTAATDGSAAPDGSAPPDGSAAPSGEAPTEGEP
ncbi:MAG: ATP-binding protein [Actinomycetota bacterium]|nr:ATP-binding protein [Actinomycetota bacterium]